MARSSAQIRLAFINSLVTTAAALGLTINPNNWISVPGSLSQTDYKLLLLNMGVDAQSFEEQLNDLFQSQQEVLIASAAPQTGNWFQYQMLLFQFNVTTPQVPSLQPSSAPNALSVVWNPVVLSYQVIKFCSVVYGSAGRCLIKVAAISAGVPADLDTIAGAGALAAATSFVNLIAAPGISYVVTSGISDWLFLQLDVYYTGVYSAVIFSSVSQAITTFLNSIPFNGIMKLSALEEAILAVAGVQDMDFVNVAARPDAPPSGYTSSWGSPSQEYLVAASTEEARSWDTIAGYIAVEDGGSTGGAIPNSQLGDFRVGSSGILNLNCIAE